MIAVVDGHAECGIEIGAATPTGLASGFADLDAHTLLGKRDRGG